MLEDLQSFHVSGFFQPLRCPGSSRSLPARPRLQKRQASPSGHRSHLVDLLVLQHLLHGEFPHLGAPGSRDRVPRQPGRTVGPAERTAPVADRSRSPGCGPTSSARLRCKNGMNSWRIDSGCITLLR